jgi:general secretion pathway protein G
MQEHELAKAERRLRCTKCGYALFGLPVDHLCPECGHSTFQSRIDFARRRCGIVLDHWWVEGLAIVFSWACAALVLGSPSGRHSSRSKTSVARVEAKIIHQLVDSYLVDASPKSNPATLQMLTQGPNPTLNPADLIDPWRNPYVLLQDEVDVTQLQIGSYGADGEPGGTGEDVDVWE